MLAGLVLLGHSWWQLAAAAEFGLLSTQAGFLAHDIAHRQVFESGKADEWSSRFLATSSSGSAAAGGCTSTRSTTATRTPSAKDMDLDADRIVFAAEDAVARTGPAGRLNRSIARVLTTRSRYRGR